MTESRDKKTRLTVLIEGGLKDLGIENEEERRDFLENIVDTEDNLDTLLNLLQDNHVMGANLEEE